MSVEKKNKKKVLVEKEELNEKKLLTDALYLVYAISNRFAIFDKQERNLIEKALEISIEEDESGNYTDDHIALEELLGFIYGMAEKSGALSEDELINPCDREINVALKNRSFLTLKDFSQNEIIFLLDLARYLKNKKKSGINTEKLLENKNIVLLFEKTSTRTRCAFEVAAHDEGAGVTFLGLNDSNFKKETIEDCAKVLGRMYDGIEFRGYNQSTVEELAKYSGVPVWNGLTDDYHPTQILADLLTIQEHCKKPFDKIKFVFVGDGKNNMANSLMIGAAKVGMDFTILSPKELRVDGKLVEEMEKVAKKSGGKITLTDDMSAVKGADVIYTDVWISIGEKVDVRERVNLLKKYQVNMDMIRATGNKNVIFMHCLPAFHNLDTEVAKNIFNEYGVEVMEVTDEVFRSKHSVVFDQAENRLHTIKAVMVATIG